MPSSSVLIRPAALSDLDFIVDGNLGLARETEDLTLDASVLRDGVHTLLDGRAAGSYWIAEIDGNRVGQTMVTYEWSDWRNRTIWWIQSVYVVQGARKHGVFRQLYEHIRSEALRAGAGGIRLYVENRNERAQQVYAALGMSRDHYSVFEDMF